MHSLRKHFSLRAFLLAELCVLLSFLIAPVSAEQRATHEPKPCVGYNSAGGEWGWQWMYRGRESFCAPDQALMEVDDPAGPRGPGELINATGNCCSLPAGDILLDEHVIEQELCPEGYVATGKKVFGNVGEKLTYGLRCTKLNAERYQLSEPSPGVYWGVGTGFSFWNESKRITRADVLPALRTALGRMSRTEWDVDGCVGEPPGSLLVGKKTKRCSGFLFSRLEYAGLAGDPAAGTPVKMFPPCEELLDPLDQNPGCRTAINAAMPGTGEGETPSE